MWGFPHHGLCPTCSPDQVRKEWFMNPPERCGGLTARGATCALTGRPRKVTGHWGSSACRHPSLYAIILSLFSHLAWEGEGLLLTTNAARGGRIVFRSPVFLFGLSETWVWILGWWLGAAELRKKTSKNQNKNQCGRNYKQERPHERPPGAHSYAELPPASNMAELCE